MTLLSRFTKDKKLGVSQGRRAYDLPLQQDAGAHFLVALIALMTLLASLALAGYLLLDQTSQNWISGLENKATIEIPAEDKDGKILTPKALQTQAETIQNDIKDLGFVSSAVLLDASEVQNLIEPWLGTNALTSDIPLPALISVELTDSDSNHLQTLQTTITSTAQNAHLDTHDSWLTDLLKITGTLKLSAGFVTIIITLITIIAISGAILTRMELSRSDVELLHLMGANDAYITRQFQRHAFILSLKGTLIGIIVSLCILLLLSTFTGGDDQSILPTFTLDTAITLKFLTLAAAICALSSLSARFTILRALSQMP